MRYIKSQITPPICENCQTQMKVVQRATCKMWECPNKIECGGQPRLYYERNKKIKKVDKQLETKTTAKLL